jgi:hypothetical protein
MAEPEVVDVTTLVEPVLTDTLMGFAVAFTLTAIVPP